ncbi:hypothetical protein L218DRAFT_847541, partial [Marasmius fiardii PR-910]
PPQTQAVGSATFRPPVLDGSMNLLDMCDWHYENSPNHPTFIFPRKDGTTRTITWRETASAVYRGVHTLSIQLRLLLYLTFRTVETIGYNTTLLASMRANFIPLLISTRNSLAIIAHLLVAGRVQYVLVSGDEHSQQLLEQAFDILRSNGDKLPNVAPMLLFGELYVGVKDETPPPRTRKNLGDVAIYLQSSMSTGKFPKLIPRCYRKLLENAIVPYYGGKDFSTTAGCGIVTACFEPQFPPTIITPSSVLEASEQMKCDIIMTFPSFIEEWSRQPEKLRWLKKRGGHLAFSGCPLGKEIGDKVVSEGISVIPEYGAVDTGTLSTWFPKSSPGEDWEYFQFSGHLDVKFIPHGDDTYEVVLMVRSASYYCLCPVFYSYLPPTRKPSANYIPHLTNTNPAPLETILRKDALIRGAVLFGNKDRLQLGALI